MKLVTSVAEHAVALMFSIVKKIVTSNASVHDAPGIEITFKQMKPQS